MPTQSTSAMGLYDESSSSAAAAAVHVAMMDGDGTVSAPLAAAAVASGDWPKPGSPVSPPLLRMLRGREARDECEAGGVRVVVV